MCVVVLFIYLLLAQHFWAESVKETETVVLGNCQENLNAFVCGPVCLFVTWLELSPFLRIFGGKSWTQNIFFATQ